MDGVGPVQKPDPKVFLNPPVWHRDQSQKPKPQPSVEAEEPDEDQEDEEEDQEDEEEDLASSPEHHGLDLEA